VRHALAAHNQKKKKKKEKNWADCCRESLRGIGVPIPRDVVNAQFPAGALLDWAKIMFPAVKAFFF